LLRWNCSAEKAPTVRKCATPNQDFRAFAALLNAKGVEYLVVGGYALATHGHPRYTGDA
jgi:hypothetical protein